MCPCPYKWIPTRHPWQILGNRCCNPPVGSCRQAAPLHHRAQTCTDGIAVSVLTPSPILHSPHTMRWAVYAAAPSTGVTD